MKRFLSLLSMLLLLTSLLWSQKTTIIRFDSTQITSNLSVDYDRYSVGTGDPAQYVATVPFSETKPLFEKADGSNAGTLSRSFAFKGGHISDHSYATASTTPVTLNKDWNVLGINGATGNFRYSFGVDSRKHYGSGGTGTYIKNTIIAVWTKDQFADGASGTRVVFDANSKIEGRIVYGMSNIRSNAAESTPAFRYIIKNGGQYYISERTFWTGALYNPVNLTYTLSNFNNSTAAGSKWIAYDPFTMTNPVQAAFSSAAAVDFDDVQAVGFLVFAENQYERQWAIREFTVEATKVNTTVDPDLLVYDGFNYPDLIDALIPDGTHGGGFGWSTKWGAHSASRVKVSAAGLVHGNLQTSGFAAYMGQNGGSYNCNNGRKIDAALPGLASHVTGDQIDKGTVWVSALMKPIAANSFIMLGLSLNNWMNSFRGRTNLGLMFNNNTTENGYVMDAGHWQILAGQIDGGGVGGELQTTTTPAAIGEVSLVVAKIEFDAAGGQNGGKITLFVNPDMTLAEPTGGYEMTTTKDIRFNHFLVGFDGPQGSTIDELRLGTTYPSVVPEAPKPTFNIADNTPNIDIDLSNLSNITATFDRVLFKPNSDYVPASDSDLPADAFVLTGAGRTVSCSATLNADGKSISVTPDLEGTDLAYYTDYTLTIKGGLFMDAFATLTGSNSVTFRTICDPQPLTDKIAEATSLHAAAIEGPAQNQYDPGSKAILQTAIDAAQTVLNAFKTKTLAEMNQALSDLDKAIELFNLSRVGYIPSGVVEVFRDGFGDNGWTQDPAFSDMGPAYYPDGIYIHGDWFGGAQCWENPSMNSVLGFNDGDTRRIGPINTSGLTDIRLTMGILPFWVGGPGNYSVAYSVNGTDGWIDIPTRTEANYLCGDTWNWALTDYGTLPASETLYLRIKVTGGSGQIDDIVIKGNGTARPPVITLNVTDDEINVPVDRVLTATSTLAPLVSVPALTPITDYSAIFTFRESGATGKSLDLTVTPNNKVFTLTPAGGLKLGTVYYLAVKDRSMATEDGLRANNVAPVTFQTVNDRVALQLAVDDANDALTDYEGIPEGTEEGNLFPNSRAKLHAVLDPATIIAANERALQTEIDAYLAQLTEATVVFRNSILSYNLDGLKVIIEASEELRNSKTEGDRDGDQIIGSKATFQRVIDHAKQVRNNPASSQAEIEATILVLLDAMGAFENAVVVVDYSALEAAVTAANALLSSATIGERNGDHVTGSDVVYQNAIAVAQTILDDSNTLSGTKLSQAQVNNAVNVLAEATKTFNKAIVSVNYIDLTQTIVTAQELANNPSIVEGLRNGDYVVGSKGTLQNAINAAQSVKDNSQATQMQINTATETLKTAMTAFKAAIVKVDYNALKSAISQALTLYNQSIEGGKDGDRLPGSKAVFLAAIDAAKAVRDNVKATQAEADNAAGALATAQSEFEAATYHVDYSGLSSAIDTADNLLSNAREGEGNGDYKAQSISALSEAASKAGLVIINAGINPPTQTRVNNSEISLLAAIASFEKSVIVVDYRSLNSAIDNAQAIKSEDSYEDKYNNDKKADFESALAHAESVSDNTNATQTEVNNAAALLIQAQKALLLTIGIDGTAIENIVVYPNPAVGYIRVGGLENVSVKIFAANGALVMAIEKYNGEDIDISSLSSGSYILNANGANIQWLKK